MRSPERGAARLQRHVRQCNRVSGCNLRGAGPQHAVEGVEHIRDDARELPPIRTGTSEDVSQLSTASYSADQPLIYSPQRPQNTCKTGTTCPLWTAMPVCTVAGRQNKTEIFGLRALQNPLTSSHFCTHLCTPLGMHTCTPIAYFQIPIRRSEPDVALRRDLFPDDQGRTSSHRPARWP